MSTSTDFLLAIEDLTVSFDGFKAVDTLNMYIDKNELRVIIGPNGAGKTTLLDLICGKTKASSGSIKFKNHEDILTSINILLLVLIILIIYNLNIYLLLINNIVKDKAKILYCINYPTISSSLKKKLISFSAFTFESDP